MFDHGEMAAPLTSLRVVRASSPQAEVERLRSRMQRMQPEPLRQPVATPEAVRGLLDVRTGGAYRVDDQSLAIAMLSAVSGEGAWVGAVGLNDLGLEAATEVGLDLARTVVIPEPGELWLEAVTALVDVLPAVLLRPPKQVPQRLAATVAARLRKREATLFVQGDWPGVEARLWLEQSRWVGLGEGHGRLHERFAQVGCRRGTAPPQFADWPSEVEEPRSGVTKPLPADGFVTPPMVAPQPAVRAG